MNDMHEDRQSVYEIGYLIVNSIPEENIPAESDKVKDIIVGAGASVIAEEKPRRERLAYTMRRKTVSGSYEKYDEAYFGWVKFEIASAKVEAVKKAVTVVPSVLRMLMITTVRENTYAGKHASAIAASFAPRSAQTEAAAVVGDEAAKAAPATVEEMDKSIDEMVKEI